MRGPAAAETVPAPEAGAVWKEQPSQTGPAMIPVETMAPASVAQSSSADGGAPAPVSSWHKAAALSAAVPESLLQRIADDSAVWAPAHGLLMARKGDGSLGPVPFALLPSPVPQHLYHEAVALAPAFSALVLRLGRDPDFLSSALAEVESADEFTHRLFSMYRQIESEGPRQRIELLISRSDYMMHWDGRSKDMMLKQVELNTIAAAAGMISEVACRLHRHIVERFAPPGYDPARMPRNETRAEIPAAMAAAVSLYRESRPEAAPDRPLVVLMVVQQGEWNIFDQKHTEYHLHEQHRVPMIRRTLAEVADQHRIDSGSGALLLDEAGEEVEVALVYYRAGYGPADYPTEKEWAARLVMERSAAVKCPSIAHHLLGTKKVQQHLSLPGVLEGYADALTAARLRRCFAGLYGLRPEEVAAGPAAAAVEAARERPGEWVLKPQREGGGNNLFDEALRRALDGGMDARGLSAHVLMERIRGPSLLSYVAREGRPAPERVVWELGIYGAVVADAHGNVVHNRAAGHLLRSRLVRFNETGLSSGYGVLDSPYLC